MDAAVFEADEVGSGGGEGGRHGRSVGGCRRRLSISIRETTLHSTTHRRAGMDSDGTQPVLVRRDGAVAVVTLNQHARSEKHTSELQLLMRISSAGFCM